MKDGERWLQPRFTLISHATLNPMVIFDGMPMIPRYEPLMLNELNKFSDCLRFQNGELRHRCSRP